MPQWSCVRMPNGLLRMRRTWRRATKLESRLGGESVGQGLNMVESERCLLSCATMSMCLASSYSFHNGAWSPQAHAAPISSGNQKIGSSAWINPTCHQRFFWQLCLELTLICFEPWRLSGARLTRRRHRSCAMPGAQPNLLFACGCFRWPSLRRLRWFTYYRSC